MLYNHNELPQVAYTAGKITILTAFMGVLVFVMAFIFDTGAKHIGKLAHATGTATTTLTVLNTPPAFTLGAYEVVESSTSSPTNSGRPIIWSAIGEDSNGAPYFLLICSSNATPTANAASGPGNLGSAPPDCGIGATQWGVSASTTSGAPATVSTTTTESAPFAEQNDWYAWVCDDDPFNPRCNSTPVQGLNATNSSPFNVNRRPVFSGLYNTGPADPAAVLAWNSTSSDPDVVAADDSIYLVVCQSNGGISTSTRRCLSNDDIASTSVSTIFDNTSATYTVPSIMRDDTYPAYGYVIDEHGHTATGNPIQANFVVNNVAPVVLNGDVILNEGNTLILTEAATQTTGFLLDFIISDANSCENASSGDEIVGFTASVYRTSITNGVCDGSSLSYNPNNCYPSGHLDWNLSCTASSTSCSGPTDDTVVYNCSFPLWFVADPTDNGVNTPAVLETDTWSASVAGIDDNALTGNPATSSIPVELNSFSAIDLLTGEIPYGSLEPGATTTNLSASTTIQNVGNTGLDQTAEGEHMCPTFSVGNECWNSASSTVPDYQQKFSSTSLAYASPLAITLSSTTPNEVELNVLKSTSTSAPATGTTYWGIAVPASITLAGSYSGLNTFYAQIAEAADWGY